MSRVKGIFFDMDGVLIDAKEWHYNALNEALSLFDMEISFYDHITSFDGLPTKEKLKILSSKKNLPERLHPFINKLKQSYTNEIIVSKCRPVFQHEYALSHLKKIGFSIAVCSNSIKDTIDSMMKYSCLDKYIDLILSNEDVKFSKPNPEIYIKAMEYFSLSPKECLILEDNENGINAAVSSGAHLLQVDSIYDVTLDNILKKIERIEM